MTDKYFKDASNKLHVIDANFVHLLPDGVSEISKIEYDASVSAPLVISDSEKLAEFKAGVQIALDKSDLVALRAFKAGIAFGPMWTKYDSDLRDLMSVAEWSESLVLPTQPDSYPS